MDEHLMHYGTPRHSGRYPWGSGENPYQRTNMFRTHVKKLRDRGLKDTEIAKSMGMTTSQLRAKIQKETEEEQKYVRDLIFKLHDKGLSPTAISKRTGVPDSTVRRKLKEGRDHKDITPLRSCADALAKRVKQAKYVDVSAGNEYALGVSKVTLDHAIALLKEEGYNCEKHKIRQVGTGKDTWVNILSEPGTTWGEVQKAVKEDKISAVQVFSEDRSRTFLNMEPPVPIKRNRIKIRYAEDGGVEKDGVIEIRRGVDDLSLGNAKYVQARINVDNEYYLKGMVIYSDDIPKGYDIIFNTNKKKGASDKDVFKELKDDKDNPFGATIKLGDQLVLAQRYYTDKDGKKHQSAINVVNEEGNWSEWRKTLASQVLSKQNPQLAKKQLDKTYLKKEQAFNEIMSYTNPVVRAKLLQEFSDECDSASVTLKAAALPRQSCNVILPFSSINEKEVYAPGYDNGEKVALIRYPHGGLFEIPVLTVNNRNKEAERTIGRPIDAIGINHKVAAQLSGADFDGDSVLVIPTKNTGLQHQSPLPGLKNFDTKTYYNPDLPEMSTKRRNSEMGKASNLITDMTIKGANREELERAVKYSMVVIDAKKHHLDYKKAFDDYAIGALKENYQGGKNKGASTLISMAKSEQHIDHVKETIDKTTGEKIFKKTGATYSKPIKDKETGEVIGWEKAKRGSTYPKMALHKNAYDLSSGTKIENIYAEHANKLKALANEARKEMVNSESFSYSPSAKKAYANEVARLNAALNIAKKNAPLERKAHMIANKVIAARRKENPDLDNDDLQKLRGQAISAARHRIGAKKEQIVISDKEWEAIQAGAISKHKLQEILNNADMERVKDLATPKKALKLSEAKKARIKALMAAGYTQREVATAVGVSTSTVFKIINE